MTGDLTVEQEPLRRQWSVQCELLHVLEIKLINKPANLLHKGIVC